MNSSQKNRVRLSIDALEHRSAGHPGDLATGMDRPGTPQFIAAHAVESSAGLSRARPFHAEDSGTAVINGDFSIGTTITASASGRATHLGAFTLNDTSTVVGVEGPLRYIAGEAELVADNGDRLCASFTGTVDLATLTATVTFEWTGGDGRFTHATGTTVWHVSLNPDLTYTAVADGVINY